MLNEVFEAVKRAGAIGVGVTPVVPMGNGVLSEFEGWLANGENAGMNYLENYPEIRRNPELLLPGAKSMLCAAFPYPAESERDPDLPMISVYAMGEDYHTVLRKRLTSAAEEIAGLIESERGVRPEWRVCVDTAPLAERYWAVKSGMCERGLNGMAILPGYGSCFFLGEILITYPLSEKDLPESGEKTGDAKAFGCGECRACVRACPTGALQGNGLIDCRRCLSYLTIEHRGAWTAPEAAEAMATEAGRNTLYGCDRCVRVCPHNRGTQKEGEGMKEFEADPRMLTLTAEQAEEISDETFRELAKGKAIKRAKAEGLRRNGANCMKKRN